MSNCIFPNTTKNDIVNFVESTIPQMITKKVNIDKYKELYKKYDKYDIITEWTTVVLFISYVVTAFIFLISFLVTTKFEDNLDKIDFGLKFDYTVQFIISIAVLSSIWYVSKIYFKYKSNIYYKQCLNIKLPIIELLEYKLHISDSESVFESLLAPGGYNTYSGTISGFESIFTLDRIRHIIDPTTVMFRIHENDTIALNISMDDNKNIYFDVLVNGISYKRYTINGPTDIVEFNKLTKNIKSTNTYDFTYLDDRFNEYYKMACDAMEKLEIKE